MGPVCESTQLASPHSPRFSDLWVRVGPWVPEDDCPAWDAHQSGSPNPNPNLLTGQRDWKPAVFQSPELGEKTCGVQGCTCRCRVFQADITGKHWSISWCKESQIFPPHYMQTGDYPLCTQTRERLFVSLEHKEQQVSPHSENRGILYSE